MSLATITQAIWTYADRTRATGTPATPTTRAEEIAQAIWTYGDRRLTHFAINSSTGEITILENVGLASGQTWLLVVRATDDNGVVDEGVITIDLIAFRAAWAQRVNNLIGGGVA